jgi:L-fucose isomerase-like protein
MMNNVVSVKLGLIAVSRDCFPIQLSEKRRTRLAAECKDSGIQVTELKTIIENESDVAKALREISDSGINALVVYLGNFGPEGPETLLVKNFSGISMLVGAAEESGNDLINGRGDAYCGMLNASYNLGLRKLKAYIPEYPIGTAPEVASMISDFVPVARVVLSLRKLKIFSFGPRPQDFLACNAPIKPLYDIGVEIMENSELDLLDIYRQAKDKPEIKRVIDEMTSELGKGNRFPDLIPKLAQYEVALTSFMEKNLGLSEYGVFANKCWPAFEHFFEFVPCYVNSRLASRGIPVACEVDIYGALSEYMVTAATQLPATLLDINNSVPRDMYDENSAVLGSYKPTDLFMGFHCGNTASCCLTNASMNYQLIMHRLLENGKEPNITRGTLEGTLRPGQVTLFRLQSTADTRLRSYVADGEILNINPKSFGCISVFAINEMGRFYRHVLIEKQFPHHAAIAFDHCGKTLFEVLKYLGINDINYNQPQNLYYSTENVFNHRQ